MTSRERVLAALGRERPDYVPMFEWLVHSRVRNALCPGADIIKFTEWADLDAVVVYADETPSGKDSSTYVDVWGITLQTTEEEYPVAIGHPLRGPDDLEGFKPPDPSAEWQFRSLIRTRKHFGNEKAIVFRLRDAYSLPRNLVGIEKLMIYMIMEPEFVTRLVDMSVNYYIAMARVASRLGADVFWTSDDYCDNKGPVMGPEHWRHFCLPGLRRLVAEVHALNKPFIKHCDGHITPIADDLVNSGIDCLDPIDVGAHIHLRTIKQKYGDRIAIKGGVPLDAVLCKGTPADVRSSVRSCIEIAGPAGYILSSSSDIPSCVPPENYAAMLEAWREFR